jgi:methyl-accepting chemotaxis protein
MSNWTISRRIIAGFVTMVLIAVALGAFALWRLTGLAQNIADLADHTLPRLLTLREFANQSRDNLVWTLQVEPGSSDRNTQLEQQIAAGTARRDDLFKTYEGMIADGEDRRLFEEVSRARDAMTASRTRALELLRENKADEAQKLLQEAVIPGYEKYFKAIDLEVAYNAKAGKAYADAGKRSALLSVRLIGGSLILVLLLATLLAWLIIRSTNHALANITHNLDQGSLQTASAARQVSMASQALAYGASEQASSVEETSTSLEEIASSRKGSQCTSKVEESLMQIAEKVTSTDSLVAEIAAAAREQAQGIEQINTAIAQLDKISQSNSASAEESASAAEELDAQAATLKDQVAKLRQLVGGNSVAVSNSPVSSARLLPKMTPAITGRRAIPMPGDSVTTAESEDGSFRNF